MLLTDSERTLLISQLRKARDEMIRAKLMMKGVASDEVDGETVEELEDIIAFLNCHIDSIVKAELKDDEEDEKK